MKRAVASVVREGWLVVVLCAVWWVVSAGSDSVFFPPLQDIVTAFRETWLFARVETDVVPSLVRLAEGYALAVVSGIGVGLALGLMPSVRAGTSWIVTFFQALPPVALIPFAIVLLGVGNGEKVFLIALGSVWPILLNTIDGVRGVPSQLYAMARLYRFGRVRTVLRVTLPSAGPQIAAGMRTSLAVALILTVTSEMVASTNGIGYFVLQAQQTFAIPEMWSGILLLGLLGYLFNFGFVALEHRVLFWHHFER